MALTSSLSLEEKRLLNVAYMRALTVPALLARADAQIDDIRVLMQLNFLLALTAAGEVPVEQVKADRRDATIRLAELGRRWVTTNPRNRLLRDLQSAASRGLSLAKALEAGADTVHQVLAADFATLRYAGDRREVPRLTDYAVRHARDYVLVCTRRVGVVLGP